jgi:hypothetical protein
VDDAKFCRTCGEAIGVAAPGRTGDDIDKMAKDFAKDMERYGKEAGRRAEEFARDITSDVKQFIRGESVCPQCETSWRGVHDYCAKCGSGIK